MNDSKKIVYASGCIVFRREFSQLEVLLAHRPRYDDWSFPKGKRDVGETDYECALREVEEEVGSKGVILAELTPIEYDLNAQKRKIVRFWIMEYSSGKFKPNNEVDKIKWFSCSKAKDRLTYDRDRLLLKEFISKVS